jgi:hypothetical protein
LLVPQCCSWIATIRWMCPRPRRQNACATFEPDHEAHQIQLKVQTSFPHRQRETDCAILARTANRERLARRANLRLQFSTCLVISGPDLCRFRRFTVTIAR